MKIGLMTWFQYYNYGTALQLVAMNKLLSSAGDDVSVINYHTRPNRIGEKKSFLSSCYGRIQGYRNRRINNKETAGKFLQFYADNLKFTRPCEVLSELEELNTEMDCFVCGSDQIWNPALFDSHYYFDFVFDNNKMIAYAPSMSTPVINNLEVADRIRNLSNRFKYLSVREKNGAKLLKELIGRDVNVVLDPTFLLDASEWDAILTNEGSFQDDYILVYMLGDNEKYWKQVFSFAKKMELPIKIIPVFKKDFGRPGCVKESVGPEDFVSLIKNAKYVLTDSFHGVAFSIIYRKNFNVFERFSTKSSTNQNSRIYNILELTGLQECLISNGVISLNQIDFASAHEKLNRAILNSKSYLYGSLDSVKERVGCPVKPRNIKAVSTVCCGCGACAETCNFSVISMKRNDEGFFEAFVDEQKCVACGRCISICPMIGNEAAIKISDGLLYSYKDKRENVLKNSSSGGAGYALSEIAIAENVPVVGCEFDSNKQETCHAMVFNHHELYKLQGSKYMQSRFFNVMSEISDKTKNLYVFGLPCQIAAARKVHGDNACYIDLICHGVPTWHLFNKYQKYLSEQTGFDTSKMKVVFRDKEYGWHERSIRVSDDSKMMCFNQHKDPYYLFFESTLCFSKSCYECPWRDKSLADIRIGDYWGPKFKQDETGVSMVLALTEKGRAVTEKLSAFGELQPTDTSDILKWQQTENDPLPLSRKKIIDELANENIPLQATLDKYIMPIEKSKEKHKNLEKIVTVGKKIIGYSVEN